jgi:hypothetical protein
VGPDDDVDISYDMMMNVMVMIVLLMMMVLINQLLPRETTINRHPPP